MTLSSAHWLDQAVVAYMVIGIPIAVWLIWKEWAIFRPYLRKENSIYTAVTLLLSTVVIALGWPFFLALYFLIWLLQRPRVARWYDRKVEERRNREDEQQ
jgi:hypothetical protein